jgi:hypothetical protein
MPILQNFSEPNTTFMPDLLHKNKRQQLAGCLEELLDLKKVTKCIRVS